MRDNKGRFTNGAAPYNQKIDRTGETRMMNNGLSATIIEYRNSNDIVIRFSNGIIVYEKSYQWFRKGKIRCPSIVEYVDDYARVTNVNIDPPFSFIIDIEDLHLVSDHVWNNNANGYARNNSLGYLHRIIMNAYSDQDVDHINHDVLDNRKCNLRLCTATNNMRNQNIRTDSSSGYKGVTWHKQRGKWAAQIQADGRHISLGLHDDILDAAKAYNEAAVKYHGDFAKINTIP